MKKYFADFDRYDSFTPANNWTIPVILEQIRNIDISKYQHHSVVDKATFTSNWNAFTQGCFDAVDWTNIVVAGGSVLGCLLPNFIIDNVLGTNGFHNSGITLFYKILLCLDIDIFVYGLDVEQANKKMEKLIAAFATTNHYSDIIISPHAITIIGFYPFRHIQIILRLYRFN
jgi:hypothetical protein